MDAFCFSPPKRAVKEAIGLLRILRELPAVLAESSGCRKPPLAEGYRDLEDIHRGFLRAVIDSDGLFCEELIRK